jgi:hypothetical protein
MGLEEEYYCGRVESYRADAYETRRRRQEERGLPQ